jgi:hypothetical protein
MPGRVWRRPGLGSKRGSDMANVPEWKKALQEPNAIGWIGFFILVILIGIGTLYFGGRSHEPDQPPLSHASR